MREDDGINRFEDILGPRLYDISRSALAQSKDISDVKRIEFHLNADHNATTHVEKNLPDHNQSGKDACSHGTLEAPREQ